MKERRSKLNSDFGKAGLKKGQKPGLEHAFKAAAGRGAVKALKAFNHATQRLHEEENKFKARPRWEKLSLKHYLRSPGHLSAIKDFAALEKTLLSLDSITARPLIRAAALPLKQRSQAPA